MRAVIVAIAVVVMMISCDVHEFPDECYEPTVDTVDTVVVEDTGIDVVLQLDYSTELPLYQEVEYTKTRSSSDGYCVRYLINIYEPESDGSYGREYSRQIIVTGDDITRLDTCLTLNMEEEGEYKFIVWTDYVDYGSQADKYYDTSDFAEIALTVEYEGSTDYRDAFKGTTTATIYEGCDTVPVSMERPLAKFEFITTDLDRFIEKVAALQSAQDETRGNTEAKSVDIDLDDYSVVIAYTAYMPYSFNIFTDRPADSVTGMYFYGSIEENSDTEASLGFDYVFVNGIETSVQTALYVYDKSGTLIASTDVISVPLLRSHLTTVYGEFLTSEASGGVGINPDYDGEYNIEIK